MRIWIDCEFNSYLGELISLALVTEAGDEFYRAVEMNGPVDPWVAENVMTVLHMPPIPLAQFHAELENFLRHFDEIHVIADWPEDIAYFMRAIVTGPGTRIDTPPMTMGVVRCDAPSEMPHNALSDARGIRDYMLAEERAMNYSKGVREWWVLHCPPWPGGVNFRTMGEALDCIDKSGNDKTYLATWIHQAGRLNYSPEETRALIAGRKSVRP